MSCRSYLRDTFEKCPATAIPGNNSVIRYGYSSRVRLRTGINSVKAPGGAKKVVNWGIRMSGPKCISYTVDAEVLERLRRREKSLEDLMAAESRLRGLISRCDDLDLPHIVSGSLRAEAEPVGEETPTDAVAARAVSVGKSVKVLSEQLEATLAGQHRQSLSASLSVLAGGLPALADFGIGEGADEKPAEPASEASRSDVGADARRARVEDILTHLKMPVGELMVLANAAIGARPLRHETLLGQLRRDVRLANDLYDRAIAASHNGLGLAGHFDGEPPPDVIAAQSLVMRIDEEGFSHSLVQRVAGAEKIIGEYLERSDNVKSARDTERARRHVEDSVKESFAALGYAVTDLEPTVVGGAVLSGPSSTHHGVQFAVDGNEIAVRSVRIAGAEDGSPDMAADVALCASIDALTPLLKGAGVTVRHIRSVPPGIVPAPAVSAGKAAVGKSAREAAGPPASKRKKSTPRLVKAL